MTTIGTGSSAAAPRYAMLETVRDFAAEQLGGLPEHEEVRDAHAAVFWDLAKDLARPPSTPGLTRGLVHRNGQWR